ncbi:MAG: hypothetical protein ACR2RL_10665 [Gammaproteobacteria bacterium]
MTTTTVVRSACPHDCPDTCAMLTTVEDGKAIGFSDTRVEVEKV